MIQNIRRSLTDLLGAEYTAAVWRARAGQKTRKPQTKKAQGEEKGEFYKKEI